MGFGKILMGAVSLFAATTTTSGGILKSMPDGTIANLSELGAIKQDIGKAIGGKDPILGNLRTNGKKISRMIEAIGGSEEENDTDLW